MEIQVRLFCCLLIGSLNVTCNSLSLIAPCMAQRLVENVEKRVAVVNQFHYKHRRVRIGEASGKQMKETHGRASGWIEIFQWSAENRIVAEQR